VAAVEAKLEQCSMEVKCSEELLTMRTGELEALRVTSQKTLHELTALYQKRFGPFKANWVSCPLFLGRK
jgi:hypothetical protein